MKIGIPWYRREQWSRWKEISQDRSDLCESYDDWLEGAEEAIRNLTKDGVEVHKVDVGVEEFLEWATKEKVTITGFARSDYASQNFGEAEMRRLTPSDTSPPSRDELKRAMRKAKGMDLSRYGNHICDAPRPRYVQYFDRPILRPNKLVRASFYKSLMPIFS
jgi:hypothetical protein